jgi:hypothetical protein
MLKAISEKQVVLFLNRQPTLRLHSGTGNPTTDNRPFDSLRDRLSDNRQPTLRLAQGPVIRHPKTDPSTRSGTGHPTSENRSFDSAQGPVIRQPTTDPSTRSGTGHPEPTTDNRLLHHHPGSHPASLLLEFYKINAIRVGQ